MYLVTVKNKKTGDTVVETFAASSFPVIEKTIEDNIGNIVIIDYIEEK